MSMTGVSATYPQSAYNSSVSGRIQMSEDADNRPLTPPSECNPLIKQAFRAMCAQAGDVKNPKY